MAGFPTELRSPTMFEKLMQQRPSALQRQTSGIGQFLPDPHLSAAQQQQDMLERSLVRRLMETQHRMEQSRLMFDPRELSDTHLDSLGVSIGQTAKAKPLSFREQIAKEMKEWLAPIHKLRQA